MCHVRGRGKSRRRLSAVPQPRRDAVDRHADPRGDDLVGVAGPAAAEQVDLQQVQGVDIGQAQADGFGQPGVIFFASRLTAEQPSYNFAERIKVLAAQMGPKELSAEARRCAPMVVRTLQALQAAQQTLPRKPAATPPAANAAPPLPH